MNEAVAGELLIPTKSRLGWQNVIVIWLLANVVVWLGIAFGVELVRHPATRSESSLNPNPLEVLFRWDGEWYARIASEGYSWDSHAHSTVAFFPGFPLLGWILSRLLGCDVRIALLLISNGAFLLALRATADYIAERHPDAERELGALTVLALAFFPAGVFYRIAYSESLFLLLLIHFLLAVHRQRPLVQIGFLCGCATAIRPVGVGLLLPFAWCIWKRVRTGRQFAMTAVWLVPVGTWGLLAFMIYQSTCLGDPFAFFQAQDSWEHRPNPPAIQRLVSLVTLHPIWDVFLPSSPAYWGRFEPKTVVFSWQLWNPCCFVLAFLLLIRGWLVRSLNCPEFLAGMGIWGVPYVLHSHRILMQGHARFCSVLFPAFVVGAMWISTLPRSLSVAYFGLFAVLLFIASAMFGAGYGVF